MSENEERRAARDEELSLIQGMYGEDEVEFLPEASEDEACEFVLKLGGGSELGIRLPAGYPGVEPLSVFARLPGSFTARQAAKLNGRLREHIASLPLDEPQVLSAIQWLGEELEAAALDGVAAETPDCDPKAQADTPATFCRLFLHSHHIYSKLKRRDLVSLAKELGLGGFSLPGKPGLVLVEGEAGAVDAYWESVRSWCWQRINARERQDAATTLGELDGLRRFPLPFRELALGRSHLRGYLEEHGCGEGFGIFFGL